MFYICHIDLLLFYAYYLFICICHTDAFYRSVPIHIVFHLMK